MLIRSGNDITRRFIAIAALLCCLFWNTVGISTHPDNDSDFFGGILPTASSSATPVLMSHSQIGSSDKADNCPGCKFRDASVSGAIAISVIPEEPKAIIPVQQTKILRFSVPPVASSSRGPPAA